MNWTDSDSAKLREYNQKSGGALIKLMKSRVPRCTGKNIEAVALQAKFKEGYETAIQDIEDLLNEQSDNSDASNGRFQSM
jgi:hypothetical protein